MAFGKFFREIFTDASGCYSSKRTIVFISMLMFVITWVMDLFYGMTTTEFVFNGIMWVIVGGLGLTLGERPINTLIDNISSPSAKQSKTPVAEE